MSIFGIKREKVKDIRRKKAHATLKHRKALEKLERKTERVHAEKSLSRERAELKHYKGHGKGEGFSVSPKKILHKGKKLAGSKHRIGIF